MFRFADSRTRVRTAAGTLRDPPPFVVFAWGVTSVEEMPNALDPFVGPNSPRFHPPRQAHDVSGVGVYLLSASLAVEHDGRIAHPCALPPAEAACRRKTRG